MSRYSSENICLYCSCYFSPWTPASLHAGIVADCMNCLFFAPKKHEMAKHKLWLAFTANIICGPQYLVFAWRSDCVSETSYLLPVIGLLDLMWASSANHRQQTSDSSVRWHSLNIATKHCGLYCTLSARAMDANACGHCQTQRVFMAMAVLVITLISGNATFCVHTEDLTLENHETSTLFFGKS